MRRDLVPSLALRRVTRGGSGGAILIVLMATATIGTFAGATARPPRPGVRGRGLGGDRGTVPGQCADSAAGRVRPVDAARRRGVRGRVRGLVARPEPFLPLQFVAIDAPAYEQVIAGATADVHLPPAMVEAVASGQPVPALVTHHVADGNAGAASARPSTSSSRAIRSRSSSPRSAFVARDGLEPGVRRGVARPARALRGGDGLRTSTAITCVPPPRPGRSSPTRSCGSSRTPTSKAARTGSLRSRTPR